MIRRNFLALTGGLFFLPWKVNPCKKTLRWEYFDGKKSVPLEQTEWPNLEFVAGSGVRLTESGDWLT